ncbi:hypothetical protein L249_8179, partial [Ophiocordyceps polyrhachis-furcata BCC 54312]
MGADQPAPYDWHEMHTSQGSRRCALEKRGRRWMHYFALPLVRRQHAQEKNQGSQGKICYFCLSRV